MPGRRLVVSSVAFLSLSFVLACTSFGSDVGPSADAGDEGGAADTAVPAEGGLPASDGARGDDAALPGTIVLSQGWKFTRGIAADEMHVYFTEQHDGFVRVVPLEPDAPLTSSALGVKGAPTSIAVAGGVVYWCDGGNGALYHVDSSGVVLSDAPSTGMASFAVAATITHVLSLTHNVLDMSKGGVESRSPAALGSFQVLASPTGNPFDITIFGDAIYWTESATGIVATTDVTSGGRTAVAPLENDCRFITADANGVYWTRKSDNLVRAMLTGGRPQDLVSGEVGPTAIASDGSGVYWVNGAGEIRRWRAVTNKVDTIASGFTPAQDPQAHSLALTSRYVVWLTDDGKVLRHEK